MTPPRLALKKSVASLVDSFAISLSSLALGGATNVPYFEDTQTSLLKSHMEETEALSSMGHKGLRPTNSHVSEFRSGFFSLGGA